MIILASSTDELRVISDQDIDVHVGWIDSINRVLTVGRNDIASAAGNVLVGPGPPANTMRAINTMFVRNAGSTTVTVRVTHNDGTAVVEIYTTSLAPQQSLQYGDAFGFRVT